MQNRAEECAPNPKTVKQNNHNQKEPKKPTGRKVRISKHPNTIESEEN